MIGGATGIPPLTLLCEVSILIRTVNLVPGKLLVMAIERRMAEVPQNYTTSLPCKRPRTQILSELLVEIPCPGHSFTSLVSRVSNETVIMALGKREWK
jgi:hypothetical protein